jgi:hypothetical protein
MSTPVRITPLGTMDKDTDIQLLRDGNYDDAHDIRHRDLSGNAGTSIIPVRGNTLAIELGEIAAQTKLYRVYVDITEAFSKLGIVTPPTGGITIEDANQPSVYYSDPSIIISPSDIFDYFTKLKTEINTLHPNGAAAFTYSTFTTTSTYSGYFTIAAAGATHEDFVIYSTGNLTSRIELVREYINPTGTNLHLQIIGYREIDNDIFLISSTEDIADGNPVNEVGVVQWVEDTDTYTYTRQLRTTRLGIGLTHRVQVEAEKNSDRLSFYLTDNNTPPRAIYINKPYTEDGCLYINGGDYNLSTVSEETFLFLKNPDALLIVDEVIPGGQLSSGNKRYTGRFLTSSLVGTEYLYPTGLVNIYSASTKVPAEIAGDAQGVITDKSVRLTVSNIPQGLYKYFELVVIEYSGDSFSSKVVQRYNIESKESIKVEHTDIGQDGSQIAVQEILALFSRYDKVGSIQLLGNRLVLSNLEEQIDEDLSEWASAITHSLEQTTIESVGFMGDPSLNTPQYKYAEYQVPTNVMAFTSYMLNDTYRFALQVKWKNTGKWSKGYWVDDIRFDTSVNNVTTYDGFSTRRTGNNITTNLTDEDCLETNVYYVKFGGIDLDTVVGSQTIGQQISAIRFIRAERIPEVLASGMFIGGKDVAGKIQPFDYPYNNTSYAGDPGQSSDYLFFQSPDLYLGAAQYERQTGDIIKLLGSYKIAASQTVSSKVAVSPIDYADMTGYFDDQSVTVVDFVDKTPSGYVRLDPGQEGDITPGDTVYVGNTNGVCNTQHVFKLSSGVFNTLGSIAMKAGDTGAYYGQIFRDLGANLKYPVNKELTVYGSTGHLRILSAGENGIIEEEVFGGDVFNQKTHMRLYINNYNVATSVAGNGFAYYSQNVANTQMRNVLPHNNLAAGNGYLFPQYIDKQSTTSAVYALGSFGAGLASYLNHWPDIANQREYNMGYSVKDGVITETGYDINSTYTGKRKADITWSDIKILGSVQDNYRVFKPANYATLEITKGEITHMEVINGALYTWQRDSFQRQVFGEPTALGSDTGSDIIIGTGSILGNRGQEYSSIGTTKKWAIIKGKNSAGKDTVYWYNDILRKIVRFSGDGVRVISDPVPGVRGNMTSYLRTYANFLTDKYEPITGYGVHGVWNDRYGELIITFKSFSSDITEFAGDGLFSTGDTVWNPDATPIHHSGLPSIFRAKSNFTADTDAKKPGTGASSSTYWDELGPSDLPQYYTLFTIVYDEIRNGFECFHEYYPNIFINYKDNFLSPDPLTKHNVYIHDKGNFINYYGTGFNGSIESVLNVQPDDTKTYEAISFGSHITPYRIEFTTKQDTSFLTESDFEEREDRFNSPILNAALAGVVTGDTSRLWGAYLKSKVFFETGVYQKIFNYIVKVRVNPRFTSR